MKIHHTRLPGRTIPALMSTYDLICTEAGYHHLLDGGEASPADLDLWQKLNAECRRRAADPASDYDAVAARMLSSR